MVDFKNVPVDEDTIIKEQYEVTLDELNCLYQKWTFDGIAAESIVFKETDVSLLNEDEIKAKVKQSSFAKIGSSMTFSRSGSGFVFVNFNFEIQ